MSRERLEYAVILLIGIIAGGFVLVVTMRYIMPVIAPFAIAWLTALAVREPSKKLSSVLHIPAKVIRPSLAILIVLAVFGAFILFGWWIADLLRDIVTEIGKGNNPISDILSALSDPGLSIFGDGISEELAAAIGEAIGGMITGVLTSAASALTSWASIIPSALLFLLVTVISLVYFSVDLERINSAVCSVLPQKMVCRLGSLHRNFFAVAKKYLRSYLLILLITFAMMLAGFLILRVGQAPLVAAAVALLDLLPIIGVGTVLIPWSIIALAGGDHFLGIGLILLFIVNTVVRQTAEPRIVGKNLDMHPVLTLVLIYVGYALFGIWGLIIAPLLAATVTFIIREGADSGNRG